MAAGQSEKARIAAIAEAAGLKLGSVGSLTIRRERRGKGFCYRNGLGRLIRDADTIRRIRSLAIPPAYHNVRVAPHPRQHLQAVGIDAAGRRQHRYHPDWAKVRERLKVQRLASMVDSLPAVRARVARDLKGKDTDRRLASAIAVALIDDQLIRVGSESYARRDGGRGAASLLKRDVTVNARELEFCFRGKGGSIVNCTTTHASLVRAIRRMLKLPGARLLRFHDEAGRLRNLTSAEVNRYLQEAAGSPVTAKDLRMLGASAAAAELLAKVKPARVERRRRKQVAEVIAEVAESLANTPAVARKSYVHEAIPIGFETGTLARVHARTRGGGGVRKAEKTVARLARRYARKPPGPGVAGPAHSR
ncbi:DNA topoisomerase IB [Desertibaculum subflavum]|uniref:DNA topoisomerase IB n=1 Tax=Desertibaculum subflavum TaxID=2268458 RepID=UPI000E6736E7